MYYMKTIILILTLYVDQVIGFKNVKWEISNLKRNVVEKLYLVIIAKHGSRLFGEHYLLLFTSSFSTDNFNISWTYILHEFEEWLKGVFFVHYETIQWWKNEYISIQLTLTM